MDIKRLSPTLSLPLQAVETQLNNYLRFSKPNAISVDDAILKADAERLDLFWRIMLKMDGVVPLIMMRVVAFSNEKAFMMPQGPWALAAINQQDPKFDVGMFAFPGEEVGKEVTVGRGHGIINFSYDQTS